MSVETAAGAPCPAAMSEAAELYERDFYAWTQAQVALLRAWPEALCPNALDIANLAEEIESLGKSQRNAVESLLLQTILPLRKLRCHPDQSARRGWQRDVDAFRDQLDILFRDNPSLRARRAEIAAESWRRAARRLERELRHDGLDTQAAMAWAPDPSDPYFHLEAEVLADGWYPPPPA